MPTLADTIVTDSEGKLYPLYKGLILHFKRNWELWASITGKISIIHQECGIVHKPYFKMKLTLCPFCSAPIPKELLTKIRNPEFTESLSRFAKLNNS